MKHKTLVIGTGITGCSVMQFLNKTQTNFDVYTTRIEPKKLKNLKAQYPNSIFHVDSESEIDWREINQLVVSPGIPPENSIVKKATYHSIPIGCDLELFAKALPLKPIIAVTGTNGKSTLVTLIANVLEQLNYKVALAGNIGQAMLDTLTEKYDIWVLELSSFQLHYQKSLRANVACILNVTEDHIDWHGSYAAYQKAKQKIYNNSMHKVFNHDDTLTLPLSTEDSASFSLKGATNAKFKVVDQKVYQQEQFLFHCNELTLTGTHNHENVLAALTILDAFGINIHDSLPFIKQFSGLTHRSQWVRQVSGLTWINDSKGTNVGATVAALKGISSSTTNNIIWIAGGLSKGADFTPLKEIISLAVRHAILLGADKQKIAECIGSSVPFTFVDSMDEAVNKAQEYGKNGDNVLLSPACASFDMFESYVKRGEAFMQLVNQIN